MDMTTILSVYFFGVVVFTLAVVEKLTLLDFTASLIAGLFWPFLLPARILRNLMN